MALRWFILEEKNSFREESIFTWFVLLTVMGNSLCRRKPDVFLPNERRRKPDVFLPNERRRKPVVSDNSKFKEMELIEEDHISNLPDEVLSYIISFLTLREAVRTSTVSRRWKYVWRTSISSLFFDAEEIFGSQKPKTHQEWLERTSKFIGVVDKTLELLQDSKVERFRICCRMEYRHAPLSRWIRFAIMSGAKELHLDLYNNRARPECGFFSPCSALARGKNSSLNHLHLNCCTLGILRSYPGFEGFDSLTTLSLESVSLTEKDVEDLLCCCSHLERLSLAGCNSLEILRISGPSLRLKYLGVENLSRLRKITLCVATLVTFEFRGYMVNFCFENAPLLVNVMLNIEGFRFRDFAAFTLEKLPAYLPQLETLVIYNTSLFIEPRFPSQSLATYTKLTQLVMVAGSPEKDFLLWIINLLKVSPFLKKLQLHLAHLNDENGDFIRPSNFPHQYLRFVELNGFAGYTEQIDIIRYILKNAIALESMLIDPHLKSYLGDGKWKTHDHQCLSSITERERIYNLLLEESQPGVQLTIL